MGVGESVCIQQLVSIDVADMSAIYCTDSFLCGLDLEPSYTQDLRLISNKTCKIWSKSKAICLDLQKELDWILT